MAYQGHKGLRALLLVKVLFCFFVWGLPALVGPPAFLALFGLQVPTEPIYLRVLGGLVVAVCGHVLADLGIVIAAVVRVGGG